MGYFLVRYASRVINYYVGERFKDSFRLATMNCGESYKQFTLIIYESRVVIWGIFKSGTTLEL